MVYCVIVKLLELSDLQEWKSHEIDQWNTEKDDMRENWKILKEKPVYNQFH